MAVKFLHIYNDCSNDYPFPKLHVYQHEPTEEDTMGWVFGGEVFWAY